MQEKNRSLWLYFVVLLIAAIPLFALGLSNHGLWSADEPRVAEIGREMALTGNWAVPTLNQKPFLEEPPLYYGALAVTFKLFGASDKVARIPSAFFALATVLVLFFLTNAIFGSRTALFAGLILATGGEYFRVAHWIVVDSALTFFVASAMALFITGYRAENSRRKSLYYALLYVAATLAFYTKGFIGIVIPGLGILAFLAVERNVKELLRMRLWLGAAIFFAMTLPWFIALWQQAGWEHLNVFFVHNHLQRFLPASMAGRVSGAASGHHHPFYYYVSEFPSGFLPWSILLVPVFQYVFAGYARFENASPQKKTCLFALCWFFAGIIFLSIASTKRTLYLMPIFAPVSLLTALYIDATISAASVNRTGKVFLLVLNLLLVAIGMALTPGYFYLKTLYLPALSIGLLASVLVVSVLVTFIAVAGVFYLQRGDLARYWASVSVSIVLVLVFALVGVVPVLDRYKSFVPFCDQVTALVPAGTPLYGYKPDETLRGAVPFYTGRFVCETDEREELLSKEEHSYILLRDKKRAVVKELLDTNRFHVVLEYPMGSDRAMVLLSNGPASVRPGANVIK